MLTEIHKKRGEGQVKKICNWFIHNASMQKKLIISYIILVSIPLCIRFLRQIKICWTRQK